MLKGLLISGLYYSDNQRTLDQEDDFKTPVMTLNSQMIKKHGNCSA